MTGLDRVLVANRGEIAVRIIRTLRRLGRTAIAVYSDPDADAPHVRMADEAHRLGPAPAAESYLSIPRLLAVAKEAEAAAVHPGYGFLAENAEFARACADAGLVFIGPPVSAIEAMGDKITAKATVAAAGVDVVPGGGTADMSDAQLAAVAAGIGFPVLLKPSAGGGGKGMRVVNDAGELPTAIAASRREAVSSFGSGALLVERYLARPRHIEVQILADGHANVVHLGERECSLQRRHQKVIEEAPSPLVTDGLRGRLGEAAIAVARAVGYLGAGTVEFIVPGDDAESFYFMEMNTRLQVEHPVTEMVTGLDLVELQLAIAGGARLPFGQGGVAIRGHAVEARIYAEDPSRDFLPSAGRIAAAAFPAGAGIRVESGVETGSVVGVDYDPMLAKVIAHDTDRTGALSRLDRALGETEILGLRTNTEFLRALLRDPDVRAGRLDTGLIERRLTALARHEVPHVVPIAAALADRLAREPRGPIVDPFDIPTGFRIGGPATESIAFEIDGQRYDVQIRGRAAAATVRVGDGEECDATATRDDDRLVVRADGQVTTFAIAEADGARWLGRDGVAWRAARVAPASARARETGGTERAELRSPMPGTVTMVHAEPGGIVAAGEPVVVVEAMKMEHVLAAPFAGAIGEIPVKRGDRVALDALLATVEANP